MNEVWREIFCNWLTDNDCINHLERDAIIDDEECVKLKLKLLSEIIGTVKSEVEE